MSDANTFSILLKGKKYGTPIKKQLCIMSRDPLTKDLRACAGRGLKPIGHGPDHGPDDMRGRFTCRMDAH